MSSRTRSAASSFSLSIAPMISVLTGPAAGNVSMIVSDWNLMAASVSTVENTPQAPVHGSVRSSYFMPRTSRPLTYISTQSLRLAMSASNSPSRSSASLLSSPSSMYSAKLAPKSSPVSSSGMRSISTPSTPIFTPSGSSISISIAGVSSCTISSKLIPRGAPPIPETISDAAMSNP